MKGQFYVKGLHSKKAKNGTKKGLPQASSHLTTNELKEGVVELSGLASIDSNDAKGGINTIPQQGTHGHTLPSKSPLVKGGKSGKVEMSKANKKSAQAKTTKLKGAASSPSISPQFTALLPNDKGSSSTKPLLQSQTRNPPTLHPAYLLSEYPSGSTTLRSSTSQKPSIGESGSPSITAKPSASREFTLSYSLEPTVNGIISPSESIIQMDSISPTLSVSENLSSIGVDSIDVNVMPSASNSAAPLSTPLDTIVIAADDVDSFPFILSETSSPSSETSLSPTKFPTKKTTFPPSRIPAVDRSTPTRAPLFDQTNSAGGGNTVGGQSYAAEPSTQPNEPPSPKNHLPVSE